MIRLFICSTPEALDCRPAPVVPLRDIRWVLIDFRIEGAKLLFFDVKVKEGSDAFRTVKFRSFEGQEDNLPGRCDKASGRRMLSFRCSNRNLDVLQYAWIRHRILRSFSGNSCRGPARNVWPSVLTASLRRFATTDRGKRHRADQSGAAPDDLRCLRTASGARGMRFG